LIDFSEYLHKNKDIPPIEFHIIYLQELISKTAWNFLLGFASWCSEMKRRVVE
jgi:hypothetical protein